MSTDIYTMNLSESSDGMVPIDMGNRSNAFVPEAQSNTYAPEIKEEKNIHDYKDDMDSTPISDILGGPQEGNSFEPPLMAVDPRAVQVAQANAMMPQIQAAAQKTEDSTKKKNPFDLTDDQLQTLVVVFATAVAVSKPIQEKLANTVPRFLNAQGNRSLVGLASTGAVAGVVFYITRKYF